MKKTTIATLMVATMALPQLAPGAIVLAGWHEFTLKTNAGSAETKAQEGVAGIYDSADTILTHGRTTTAPGGSIDGWYGPDSQILGGMRTEQVIANVAAIPGYVPETAGPGPRLNPGFVDTANYAGLPANTNFDGRIASMNGTDVLITNNSLLSYNLESFVFDAFLGDVSSNGAGTGQLNPFTYTITIGGNSFTTTLLPAKGVTGVNSIAPYGPGVDTPFTNPPVGVSAVPNLIDFGTGTNYVDYVIELGGFKLAPGESFTIGFSSTGSGTIRLDNIALLAVPEPGSLMAVVGLVGSGCLFRRRKKASLI